MAGRLSISTGSVSRPMKRVVEGNLGGHPVYSVHGTVLGVGPWYRLTSSSDTGHNNTTVRERKDLMIFKP